MQDTGLLQLGPVRDALAQLLAVIFIVLQVPALAISDLVPAGPSELHVLFHLVLLLLYHL